MSACTCSVAGKVVALAELLSDLFAQQKLSRAYGSCKLQRSYENDDMKADVMDTPNAS